MEFLAPVMGETAARIVIVALVLLLTGTLGMLAIGLAMRLFGGRRIRIGETRGERAPRLAVPDALTIDARRKLVLVRRDNVEHLILVGGNTDIVVEPAIPRFTPNMRRTAATASPQPAAMPPPTGAIGPGRPLAARSQRAVEAGQHAGGQGIPPADAGLTGSGGPASDRAPAAPAAAVRPGLDKSMTAPPKSAAPRSQADSTPPAAAKANAPAARPKVTGSPTEPEGPAPRQAPSLGMEPAQARPAQAAQPARPPQSARAVEPSPSAPRVRPATRPTAAAAPPTGHPSAAPAPASSQAAGSSSPPGSAAQTPARGEPRRGQPSRRAEGDPDMTALLGEIFGQNKH